MRSGLILLAWVTASAELRIGRSSVAITPPAGTPMGGGFTIRLSTAIHDPLYCKALYLEMEATRAAIVSCDVESLHRPTIEAARRLIDAGGKLRGENAMITATHSHSGPEMTPLVAESATGRAKQLIDEFHRELPKRIADAVNAAAERTVPARVWTATGHEDSISFNRRYVMKDGSVRMNPGQNNPDIVRPAGLIDPEVRVVYFDSPDGTPLATVVNFALHTTAWGGSDFSSDFPGVAARLLAEAKHPDMLTLFLQGCSGNINQVDVTSKEKQSGPAVSARIGTTLAAEALRTYRRLRPVETAKLDVRRTYFDAPAPSYSAEDVKKAWAVVEDSRRNSRGGSKFLDVVHAFRVINVAERNAGKPLRLEVQSISLGDQLAWVGLPGEVFAELGMALKRASPFPHTVVAELANDMIDYVPNRKAYPEGSYEPTTARCSEGCGELLVDAATRLLMEAFAAARR